MLSQTEGLCCLNSKHLLKKYFKSKTYTDRYGTTHSIRNILASKTVIYINIPITNNLTIKFIFHFLNTYSKLTLIMFNFEQLGYKK